MKIFCQQQILDYENYFMATIKNYIYKTEYRFKKIHFLVKKNNNTI